MWLARRVATSSVLHHSLLALPLQRVLTAVDYCTLAELGYCWYALWRLRRKQEAPAGLGTGDRIGHMVNSDTNVKYTIVHNISFILLFAVAFACGGHDVVQHRVHGRWGIPLFFLHGAFRPRVFGSGDAVAVLAYQAMCSLGWAFIVDSREGSVAGLLVMHLVSCGVVVLQSVFSIVHVYTSEKSIYWFVKAVLSSSSRHSELVLNESALITSLCAMLCVLDMMKSL